MTQISQIVDAGDVTEMLTEALKQAGANPHYVVLPKENRAIGGDGKVLVKGNARSEMYIPPDAMEDLPPLSSFYFEIVAGTTEGDVILGELEVLIDFGWEYQ